MAAHGVCSSVPGCDTCCSATSHIKNKRHAQRDSELLHFYLPFAFASQQTSPLRSEVNLVNFAGQKHLVGVFSPENCDRARCEDAFHVSRLNCYFDCIV